LSRNDLKNRSVEHIDIAMDKLDKKSYKRAEDPKLFKSIKTSRGKLQEGWQDTLKPIMCAYKLVSVNFKIWGLQTKLENLVHEVIRKIFLQTNRQVKKSAGKLNSRCSAGWMIGMI
jgi:hypothetical protein